MSLFDEYQHLETRRQFFSRGKNVLGYAALSSLLGDRLKAWAAADGVPPLMPHFAPKARRVIYLHMVGGPSQMDLFDYKPELTKRKGEQIPD
ncbi:MAG TPA: DUF1501 domain-containing protein, partial [Verrucomicrobiota bacterium]|nr:DUF1501 domain-containing protein [Verrucomicrobiota bacterium]